LEKGKRNGVNRKFLLGTHFTTTTMASRDDLPVWMMHWNRAQEALNEQDMRLAASEFISSFHRAPSDVEDKYSSIDQDKYSSIDQFANILEANQFKTNFLTSDDWDDLVAISMDKDIPVVYRSRAALTLGRLHVKAGRVEEAAFVLRKAHRMALRSEEGDMIIGEEYQMNIYMDAADELDRLRTGEWCAGKTKFRQVPIARVKAGGFCCDRCKKSHQELHKKNLQCCGRCKRAYYCSKECQAAAWYSGHQSHCRKPEDIQSGDYMMLCGLKSKGELNGRVVRVLEYNQQTGRWGVKPAGMGNKTLAVTPDKLKHLRPLN
jgi:hypothetical protein